MEKRKEEDLRGFLVEAGLERALSLPSRKKNAFSETKPVVNPRDLRLDWQAEGEGSSFPDSCHPVPTPPRCSQVLLPNEEIAGADPGRGRGE